MDFEKLTIEELDQHAMDIIIFDEINAISPILRGHIFIEKILETILYRNLEKPEIFLKRRKPFEIKLDLAASMGLIDESTYSSFKAINNVRNNYAHRHVYNISKEELSGFKNKWDKKQSLAFEAAYQKSSNEGAKIATLFLCWQAMNLLKHTQK